MIKNVILITIDTLRANHLSCYGYYRKTSPTIDRLAREGVLFKNAFSNGPWTPFSFPSILTSTYPLQFPFNFHLSSDRITISEVLKKNGYSTAAFHSNPYLSRFYGYDRGFDVFSDFLFTEERMEVGENHILQSMEKIIKKILNERTYNLLSKLRKIVSKKWKKLMEFDQRYIEDAGSINKKAVEWLRNVKEPFFLWIHYMDVRMGYIPPKKCLEYLKDFNSSPDETKIRKLCEKKYRHKYSRKQSFSDEEIKLFIDLYDAEIRYVDGHIKLLINEVNNMDLTYDTLIVITADHGEEFLEHGDIAHGPKLYDELLHVPLIFHAPELGKGVIDDLVSLIDLAPTIVDILGIEKPKQWLGESLLPLIRSNKKRTNRGIISEVLHDGRRKICYRTKKWKLIFDEGGNRYELYDLERDKKEINNVAKEYPEVVEALSSKIKEHILLENETNRKKIKETIKKLKKKGRI